MNINRNIFKRAAIVLALVFTVSGCALPEEAASQSGQDNTPEPLIYRSGGEAYMTTGADTVLLPGAGVLNGVFAAGSLYYITDAEPYSGAGTLMRAAADCKSEPEAVAENVCDAEISPGGDVLILRDVDDKSGEMFIVSEEGEKLIASGVSRIAVSENGKRTLFISGETEGAGELYSWDMKGNPELIASGVSPDFLGFSQNTKNIYYVTKDDRTYSLYIKLGGANPVMMDERRSSEGPECFGNYMFDSEPLNDNGQMIYFGNDMLGGKDMYVYYPGTDVERYTAPCTLYNIYSDGSLLFTQQDEFYYKTPGKPEEMISEDLYFTPWFGYSRYTDMPQVIEKRFLFAEGNFDLEESKVTLFEQEIGKDAVMLNETDRLMFSINYDFTKLAYVLDGDLYVREKRKSRWSRPELVAEDVKMSSMLGECIFDITGTYFYYLLEENEYRIGGSLYRYDLNNEKSELLLEDTNVLHLIGGTLYAVNEDEEAWVLSDGKKKLASGITVIEKAPAGVFLSGDYNKDELYWYDTVSDEAVKLCEDAKRQSADGIEYRTPLTEASRASLQKLWGDAKACLAALDAGKKPQNYSQAAQLADNLRIELSDKYSDMLSDFSYGFDFLEYAQVEGITDTAEESLKNAVSAYEDIFGTEAQV